MKALLIGIIIVVILGGVVAAGFYTGFFPTDQKTGNGVNTPAPTSVPTTLPTVAANTPVATPVTTSPTNPPTVRPTVPPAVTSTPVPPTPLATVVSPPVPAASVDFQIYVSGVGGTGLSRTVTAQITNNGTADAHNVWVKSEVFSGQQKVSISGQDSLRMDIGIVKAGTTVPVQANLTFGLLDGLRIQQNGARFLLTITSDERTQTLNYDYTP